MIEVRIELKAATQSRTLAIATVLASLMALAGAGYAAYALVPGLLHDEYAGRWLRLFLLALIVSGAVLLAVSWLRKRIWSSRE
jgi:hypothetical protein